MPPSTHAQPPGDPQGPRPPARWWSNGSWGRLLAWTGPGALLALLWGLWHWTGTEGSLGRALKWAHWALPMGQQLITRDVQGNLRQGGHVGQLEWRTPTLHMQARNTHIALDWSLLWRQPWPVQSLHIQSLHLLDQGPAKPLKPWQDLKWPLPVQMALKVDHFQWQGGTAVTLSDVQAHYAYDGHEHTLQVPSLRLAQGQYTLQGRLQGAAPMALHLDVTGHIQTPAAAGTPPRVLALSAQMQGTLSGPQAMLGVDAQLSPAPGQIPLAPGQAPVHLALQAEVRPWQQQAMVQAKGQWQALDLAPLWPQAPHTHLNGQLEIRPDGPDWTVQAQWRNLQPGAWDLQRLPLSAMTLKARHHQGLWQLEDALAQVATGQIQAKAQQSPAGWTGDMAVTGIVPAQLHSALRGAPIQGRVQARETGQGPVQFEAQLQAPAAPIKAGRDALQKAAAPGFHFEQLQLAGQWHQQVWQIDALKLQAQQSTWQGRFTVSPEQASVQGEWSAQMPGLRAQARGQIAPAQGQGELRIDVDDASAGLRWLQSFPAWRDLLMPVQAAGKGQLQAQWRGGWSQADTQVQLDVQWPRLSWPRPAGQPWVMDRGQLKLVGTPLSWQAQWQSQLVQGQTRSPWQARVSASRTDLKSRQWQGLLERMDLQALSPSTQARWGLQLQEAVAWQARLDRPGLALSWSESRWQVQGPTQASSRLVLEAGDWRAASPLQAASARFTAKWDQLPLNWLLAESGMQIQNDVLLEGQVQLTHHTETSFTAQLRRTQGDVGIPIDPASVQPTAAGLRDASLVLRIHQDQLQADLKWDSAHMGQAQAQVISTLSRSAWGWDWPAQAPLRGSVQARLPQIAAWSVLAPPGWRVQGQLDARMDLAGTRGQPQWQGRLQADQLAARSAVQGMAFDQGQMQARLQGQVLIVERLSFRGAGPQGGEFSARGQVTWAPSASRPPSPHTNPLHAAQMTLEMEAKSLRVSQRADRRLVLSGQVTARMQSGQMQVRGTLKADQALYLMPEDTTPGLGEDVVVTRSTPGVRNAGPFNTPQAPGPSWMGVPDVRVMLDLGPDFQLQGRGLSTRLSGQVELVSHQGTQGLPRLNGQVRTVGGRYRAYGQSLDIRSGLLRFTGAYDNPDLEILALRPHLPQTVGVQVLGTALQPRIRLYAEPDMPDAEKLAWLVLGRSAATGGVESGVLQQAAMALLSSNGQSLGGDWAAKLGLDEVSLVTGLRSGATATGTAVTLGKRLSQDFYLAYETGLSGTLGSLLIFYDLSQRLTLRAQAGEQSALDLIFRVRRD